MSLDTTFVDTASTAIPALSDINLGQELKNAVKSAMDTQFFQGGALLALLAAIGYQLRGAFTWVYTRIERQIKYSVYIDQNNTNMYNAFTNWYYEKYPKAFRNVYADIIQDTEDYEPGSSTEIPPKNNKVTTFNIRLKQQYDFNIIWFKGWPIFVNKSRETLENSSMSSERHLHSYDIYTYFIGRKKIQSLLEECRKKSVEEYVNQRKVGIEIKYNQFDYWEPKLLPKIKTFNDIFLDNKQDIIDDLNKFVENGKLYDHLRISNKRGYLLSGPPGNGKSTLPMAIAKKLGMNLYYLNLNSVGDDNNLATLMSDIDSNSVIVLEDVDVMTGKGESRSDAMEGKTRIAFSSFLNVLNGVFEPDNCIFILTTNKPEALDPAIKRAGRVDRHFKIDNPSLETAMKFIDHFYESNLTKEEMRWSFQGLDVDVNTKLAIPMSEVQDICLRNSNSENDALHEITKRGIQ